MLYVQKPQCLGRREDKSLPASSEHQRALGSNHEMGVGQGYMFANVCAGIIACVL